MISGGLHLALVPIACGADTCIWYADGIVPSCISQAQYDHYNTAAYRCGSKTDQGQSACEGESGCVWSQNSCLTQEAKDEADQYAACAAKSGQDEAACTSVSGCVTYTMTVAGIDVLQCVTPKYKGILECTNSNDKAACDEFSQCVWHTRQGDPSTGSPQVDDCVPQETKAEYDETDLNSEAQACNVKTPQGQAACHASGSNNAGTAGQPAAADSTTGETDNGDEGTTGQPAADATTGVTDTSNGGTTSQSAAADSTTGATDQAPAVDAGQSTTGYQTGNQTASNMDGAWPVRATAAMLVGLLVHVTWLQ